MNKFDLGREGERFVADTLKNRGYIIAACNYHSKYGEIDIIAIKGTVMAFVEVKTRKKMPQNALWSITISKQKKIIKTALLYMQTLNIELQPRFDVAIVCLKNHSFELDYYKNAFESIDF